MFIFRRTKSMQMTKQKRTDRLQLGEQKSGNLLINRKGSLAGFYIRATLAFNGLKRLTQFFKEYKKSSMTQNNNLVKYNLGQAE